MSGVRYILLFSSGEKFIASCQFVRGVLTFRRLTFDGVLSTVGDVVGVTENKTPPAAPAS